MISLTKLLCDLPSYGDTLRYEQKSPAAERRPIVVWNCSRTCNLKCVHCYSDSEMKAYDGELSTSEAKKMIRSLADFRAPVLLFSGGEPLLRKDIFELNVFAKNLGLRTVVSTNGTLITKEIARRIKSDGFDYIGVSLDGVGDRNDMFRGKKGAFDQALAGIRNLVEAGQRVGLRFTITKSNFADLPQIFALTETENIGRICFYHLVYAGRGSGISENDLSHEEKRACIDMMCDWAVSLRRRGIQKEVLTVDNHADGVYIYLKFKKSNPVLAQRILDLLRANGGNSSGIGIADIDTQGFVHPDQFWHTYSFGNVRDRDFGEIWTDTGDEMMRKLKDRKSYLKGKCSRCSFLDICNGNFRVRAGAVYNDIWQEDPACYLTEAEISSAVSSPRNVQRQKEAGL